MGQNEKTETMKRELLVELVNKLIWLYTNLEDDK